MKCLLPATTAAFSVLLLEITITVKLSGMTRLVLKGFLTMADVPSENSAATMFAPFVWVLLTGVAVVFRCWREIAHQAYLSVQRRQLIERRRKLLQYDVDGQKWSDLALDRDGLPFDRVDLKGKGDDYTAMEKHLYGTSTNEGL